MSWKLWKSTWVTSLQSSFPKIKGDKNKKEMKKIVIGVTRTVGIRSSIIESCCAVNNRLLITWNKNRFRNRPTCHVLESINFFTVVFSTNQFPVGVKVLRFSWNDRWGRTVLVDHGQKVKKNTKNTMAPIRKFIVVYYESMKRELVGGQDICMSVGAMKY
jgi:hypothetical protein